jgi:hypothetical protein
MGRDRRYRRLHPERFRISGRGRDAVIAEGWITSNDG